MEQTYCLTPAEWRYAQGCLTLAKRLGLIEDDSPAALEKRRAAKNAAAAQNQADGRQQIQDNRYLIRRLYTGFKIYMETKNNNNRNRHICVSHILSEPFCG